MSRPSSIISNETLSRIIQVESAGNPRAKARTSSATGLGQFINATWLTMVRRHRPDWLEGRTQTQVLALRLDPKKSIEMLARFTEDNAAALPGAKDSDGDLYLAHFSGVGVAKQLLTAPGAAPASNYFKPGQIRANRSILEGKSVGQVRAWAEAKMRRAGGKRWVEKFWDSEEDDEEEDEGEADASAVPPRERDPEGEWTYENPKPEKTGISEAGKGGAAIGVAGIVAVIWEKVSSLPESVLHLIGQLGMSPYFWAFIAVGGLSGYVWWKRKLQKENEL